MSKAKCFFFGSTNKDTFLNDPSGSVRWLVFELCGIDFGVTDKIMYDVAFLRNDGFTRNTNTLNLSCSSSNDSSVVRFDR